MRSGVSSKRAEVTAQVQGSPSLQLSDMLKPTFTISISTGLWVLLALLALHLSWGILKYVKRYDQFFTSTAIFIKTSKLGLDR